MLNMYPPSPPPKLSDSFFFNHLRGKWSTFGALYACYTFPFSCFAQPSLPFASRVHDPFPYNRNSYRSVSLEYCRILCPNNIRQAFVLLSNSTFSFVMYGSEGLDFPATSRFPGLAPFPGPVRPGCTTSYGKDLFVRTQSKGRSKPRPNTPGCRAPTTPSNPRS